MLKTCASTLGKYLKSLPFFFFFLEDVESNHLFKKIGGGGGGGGGISYIDLYPLLEL